MRPEQAVEEARRRAADARGRGAYADDLGHLRVEPSDRVTVERLLEWAVIEPDLDHVRSTRRLGAPITLAKRALVRALRQYHGDALAQQTRFNIHVAMVVGELADRVAELERRDR